MAKKKARSKSQKTVSRRAPTALPVQRTPWWAIVVAVVLFATLIAGIGYELTRDRVPKDATPQGDSVLVSVNGKPITQSRLDFHYQLLPERYRESLSREQVLEELIAEELIIQAAAEDGVETSDEDVHARVQDILAQSDLTATELEENLASFNVTPEQFEELIKRQIILERYRASHLSQIPEPTDAEIAARYEENIAAYALPESVTVRHVLVLSERENAALASKAIYDDIRAGADICAYVENSSDDLGSKATCGEYSFARGAMVPEFEDAAFDMADGDIRLIQSQYGYHVIVRTALSPARTLTIDEARDGIAVQLSGEKTSLAYRQLVTDLRAKATIEYPGNLQMPVMEAAPERVTVDSMVETPAQPVVVDSVESEVTTEPVAPQPSGSASGSTARIVAREEPTPAEPQPTADASPVLSCIARQATLYGTQWSSDTRAARDMFSESGVSLTYVACDDDLCSDEGIGAYPTWVINGQRYVGRLTLEQLRRAADC